MRLEAKALPWWRNDASIFIVLMLIAGAGFALTLAVTKSYLRHEDALARRAFRSGLKLFNAGQNAGAVSEFRTALSFAHDNPEYRLRLAQALAADNQLAQAATYYLNLWEKQPGNGLYNLELARICARQNRPEDAARYFHAAIYGNWDRDATVRRFQARTEFIDFLLSRGSVLPAQAEAIALASESPPPDPDSRFQIADLLLRTGEFERALSAYVSLERADEKRASRGAGAAAFSLGHFRSAQKFLRAALQSSPLDPEARRWLDQSTSVIAADPHQRRLTSRERARRVLGAYQLAGKRLQQCALSQNIDLTQKQVMPSNELEQLYDSWMSSASRTRISILTREPETRESILDIVYRIEETTARTCGMPNDDNWPLLMLARHGAGVEQ